ncbi:MAG: hypothetical protein OEW11_01345 [Nitrospirota bacterium]|nr:hypothetical protein [Nitrospirota bacterium]
MRSLYPTPPLRPRRAPVWLSAGLGLLLAGCSGWQPVTDPSRTLSSDHYGSSQLAGSLMVTVRLVGWREPAPSRLQEYVTPIYLQVRNGGAATAHFSPEDVVLVDDEGTLFRAISPERLEALVGGRGGAEFQGAGGDDLGATLAALTAGDITPNTQVRGAVYFARGAAFTRTMTVRVPVQGETLEFRFRAR